MRGKRRGLAGFRKSCAMSLRRVAAFSYGTSSQPLLLVFHLPSGNLIHLVVIREEAVGGLGIPSGPYSENAWHMMFEEKDGMIVMWASEAPMDELKQLLLDT